MVTKRHHEEVKDPGAQKWIPVLMDLGAAEDAPFPPHEIVECLKHRHRSILVNLGHPKDSHLHPQAKTTTANKQHSILELILMDVGASKDAPFPPQA